ncbi:MAG: hypothetical protein E3K37_14500 [Candidatus Kuenenia sp.]|nr:hypothetical protein [Candidatus Kuenenia hertensis]
MYPPKEYHGIIRINIHPPVLEDIFSAFDKFFKSFDLLKLSGGLVILEKKGFRKKDNAENKDAGLYLEI